MFLEVYPQVLGVSTLKYCAKCGEWKELDQFPADKHKKSGVASSCKACRHQYYEDNREAINARTSEYGRLHPAVRRKSNKTYHAAHKEVRNNKNKEYREKNATRLAQKDAEKKNSPEYKQRVHERYLEIKDTDEYKNRKRDWKLANPDRVRANNYRSYLKRKHTTKFRIAVDASRHRRRARDRALPNNFTADDWERAQSAFSWCCAVCGRAPGLWRSITADHWIPVTAPGCPGTVAWNIVPLCHGLDGCNNSKQDKPAAEWLIGKFGKRKGTAILKKIEAYLQSRRAN